MSMSMMSMVFMLVMIMMIMRVMMIVPTTAVLMTVGWFLCCLMTVNCHENPVMVHCNCQTKPWSRYKVKAESL